MGLWQKAASGSDSRSIMDTAGEWAMGLNLAMLEELPPFLTYVVLGIGAALENVFPPIPADTFVVIGAFLAGRGSATLTTVFLVTWTANVVSALLVYRAAYRHGPAFFDSRLGHVLLRPRQLERVRSFYQRFGTPAIFFTRFLPGLRAIVPIFAGVSHQPLRSVAWPILVASGIWYGLLVWVGGLAGQNLEAILAALAGVNRGLLALALGVFALLGWLWYRTRHPHETQSDEEEHDA